MPINTQQRTAERPPRGETLRYSLVATGMQYSFLGPTVNNTYDAASNRTSLTAPGGGTTTYAYDSLNRLTSLTDANSGQFGFGYDALSRRTFFTRPNGVGTSYSYDSLSRLLSVLHNGGSLPGSTSYTYDAAGNRLSKTAVQAGNPNLVSVLSQYSYDSIYELTQAVVNGSVTEGYTYDAVGNRLTSAGPTSYNYNASNELTSSSVAAYTYDNNGTTLSKTTSAGTTSYTWDFENRLSSVTLPGTGGSVNFQYDPFGRRIYKSSPSGTSVYVYDGDNITEELNGSGSLVSQYTQGTGIDQPLALYQGAGPSYFHADGLGSIASLTDPTGAVAASYVYDSFGNLNASTGTIANPFQYTAREFDSETGLYCYRARHYEPISGRFLSEDPTGFKGSGTNFYPYVGNNPTNLVDALGLCATKQATADCIRRALESLFPNADVTVGNATQEAGGHWVFNVSLEFSSYEDAYNFYSTISGYSGGFYPPARIGKGPSLHLENTAQTWTYSDDTWTTSGIAHIDIGNPNNIPVGTAVHGVWDGLVGHLAQLFGGNIDPAHCPW